MTWTAFFGAMRNGVRDRTTAATRTVRTTARGNSSRAVSSQAAAATRVMPTAEQREQERIFWRTINVRR